MADEREGYADVSVIMPTYQSVPTIERALKSVAAQTLHPREIIICDDGSTDGTADLVEHLKRRFSDLTIHLLIQKNQGAGAARNRAIEKASGHWLAFLDADDTWLPDKLERSFEALKAKPYVLIAHNYIQVAPNGAERRIDCTTRYKGATNPLDALYRYGFIATSTVVVKREAVLAVGSFDETLATAQDFDLWLKVLSRDGARFDLFDSALMRYAVNPAGITSHTKRRLDCTLRVAERHHLSFASYLFRILAVHYEALTAYRKVSRFAMGIWVLVLLVGRLMGAPLRFKSRSDISRPIADWLVLSFGIWVVGAFGAYIYRFNHLIIAFYELVLGL